jgi:hypothetical protein
MREHTSFSISTTNFSHRSMAAMFPGIVRDRQHIWLEGGFQLSAVGRP